MMTEQSSNLYIFGQRPCSREAGCSPDGPGDIEEQVSTMEKEETYDKSCHYLHACMGDVLRKEKVCTFSLKTLSSNVTSKSFDFFHKQPLWAGKQTNPEACCSQKTMEGAAWINAPWERSEVKGS